MKIKLSVSEVFIRSKSLAKSSPKKFKELKNQFMDMAAGGDGGIFFLSHGNTTVRKQYYWNWKDEDFNKLLKMLEREG